MFLCEAGSQSFCLYFGSMIICDHLCRATDYCFQINEEVNSNYKSFNLEEHLIHILLIFKQIFYFRALAGLSWWCFLDVSGAVLRHDQSSRAACTHTFFLRGVLEGKSEKITITYDYIRLLGQRMNNRTFPIIGHRKA